MTHPIQYIRLDAPFVPTLLEGIIDAKIRGIALNALEEFVDWLCSWIYYPYQWLYSAKISRVHSFSDRNVKLYDATKHGVAGINCGKQDDHITLNGRRVYFNQCTYITMSFSKQFFMNSVIIKDANSPGWYQIIIQEIPRTTNPNPMETTWFVNTNQFGQVESNTYLVEPLKNH